MKPAWVKLSGWMVVVVALVLVPRVGADPTTVSTNGIHSTGLGLTGAGISIGQMEPGRPGLPGFDAATNSHPNVVPTGVFATNQAAVADQNISDHAEEVAGVMISTQAATIGVATGAGLYSSAYVTGGFTLGYINAMLAMQHIALQDGGDVRAINLSWGKTNIVANNGNVFLSQGLDWSASQHDVLYVTAADETGAILPSTPQDAFNRINVGFTRLLGGVYRDLDPGNIFTVTADGRREIDLVAPGRSVTLTTTNGATSVASGSSYAAPHVTATVALLQEYGESKIVSDPLNWDSDARHHEVMKAVLMNSADKIQDTGNGYLLGMEKTILRTDANTWLTSPSQVAGNNNPGNPLDSQMGTGQLNANQALIQYAAGEHDPGTVPVIGWDYNTTIGSGQNIKYPFDQALAQDSYIAITLAWDRAITLNDLGGGTANQYDVGESFSTLGLADLDLYLMPLGATALAQSLWQSTSSVYSVEHIFFKIPQGGFYEFWVRHAAGLDTATPYGLAWEAVAVAPEPSALLLLATGVATFAGYRRRKR